MVFIVLDDAIHLAATLLPPEFHRERVDSETTTRFISLFLDQLYDKG